MSSESPELSAPIEPETKPDAPRFVAMIEYDGREPPRNYPDREAEATWAAVSALWHPELLRRCDQLPGVEGVEFPSVPEFCEVRIAAEGSASKLPSDYRIMVTSVGTKLIEAGIDRAKIARDLLHALNDEETTISLDDPLVLDFLALGTARWMLRDLTIAMGHSDCLDVVSLTRETLAGANAWKQGDQTAATNHLRAAFELLTQAREKFYPVDAYVIDICLVDISFPPAALTAPLQTRTPITFLAPASAIERIAEIDPETIGALRQAVHDGWADVIGGTYSESDESLLPITSVFWQFLKGSEVYRKHLDDRNVETLATRRFALYPNRPQIGRRFGFRFAIHLGFDAGKFPIPRESKRLWESPDMSHLESLMRPPLGGDRPSEGLRFPWRLGKAMKDDHVATVPLLHWPNPVAGWYSDLRRMATYSPVLARWSTIGDFFHMSDRPWEMFAATADEYVTPYLSQAVARGDRRPISARAAHVRLRAELDALTSLDALQRALSTPPPIEEREYEQSTPRVAADLPFAAFENSLEAQNDPAIKDEIGQATREILAQLAVSISGSEAIGPAGYLVLNPTGIARRGIVEITDPAVQLRPNAQILSIHTADGVTKAVIDVPPFGFAWFPKQGSDGEALAHASAEGTILKNDSMEVEIDRASGGIRSIKASGEPIARIGQQLVVAGLSGDAAGSRMEGQSVEVIHGGPGLAHIRSRGRLVRVSNGSSLATFQQDIRLWAGKPVLDLSITLEDVDSSWQASLDRSDPWNSYLACRWAWPDSKASLRRTSQMSANETTAERSETPDAFEIATRNQKTALLFGGLAHHRRHGERMLDTLLIAGQETERKFSFGVMLDLEHIFHAATDFVSPLPMIATESGPPKIGPAGWLFRVESQAVHIPRIEFLERTGDGRGWGIAVYLVETSGRAVRSRLRVFKNPLDARQTDFSGELIIDLPAEGDAVSFDLTPFEMVRIEVRLG